MCNRYGLNGTRDMVASRFGLLDAGADWSPDDDIRPTNTIPVIALDHNGRRKMVQMRWGLVPPWTKPTEDGGLGKIDLTTFNARDDKLAISKLYGPPFHKGHRCLIPATSFFEWTGPKGHKTKHRIRPLPSNRLPDSIFAMAGLWSAWRAKPGDDPLLSCTIITVPAAESAYARIHDRMPAIMPDDDIPMWLGEALSNEGELTALLQPWAGTLDIDPPPGAS